MAANFNEPTVGTTYTAFPTQIIENIDAALQQLSVGSPTNVPTGAIKFDLSANRWKKYNGSAYVDLTSTYDFNAALSATGLNMGDSNNISGGTNAILLGATDALRIFHDGSNSFIRDYNGPGNLKITTNQLDIINNGNSEFMAKFIQDGSVELYENNVKRFETSSAGCTVTGSLTTTGAAAIGTNITLDGSAGGQREITIGNGRTANNFSFIDLIGDATYTTYGTRLIRGNTGANTTTALQHRGTGQLQIQASDAGKIALRTDSTTRMFIDQTGQVSIGSTNPQKLFEVASGGTPDVILRSSAASSNDAILRLRGSRTGAPTDINQIIFETNDTGGGNYTAGSRLGSIICGKQSNNTTKGFFDFRLNNTTITDGSLGAANVSKMHIKATNEVGLGTTNPQRLLELVSADQTSIIRLHSSDGSIETTDRIGMIEFSGNDSNNSGICAFIEAIASGNNGQTDLRFATGTAGSVAEVARFDRDGKFIFGRTTQLNSRVGNTNAQPIIQVHDEADGSMSLTRYSTNQGNTGRIFLQKARGTIATPAIVDDGDATGEIRFAGYDGTNFANGCTIINRVNGIVSANTLPSDLEFYVKDASGNFQELLTLNHDRFVGINKPTPLFPLHVKQLTDNADCLRLEDSGTSARYISIDVTDNLTSFTARSNNSHGTIRFQSFNGTTTSENMRLVSNTGLAIGATSMVSSDKLTVTGGNISTSGNIVAGRGSGSIGLTANDGKGNANLTFNHVAGTPDQNGNAARIEVNTDSTSDATMFFELKSNVTSGANTTLTNVLDLLETQIKPRKNIIAHSDSTVDIGSNAVRFANGYFDTLYGDGSNLTGITTDLKSMDEASSTGESSASSSYQSKVTLSISTTSSTRVLVHFGFSHEHSDNDNNQSVVTQVVTTNGSFAGGTRQFSNSGDYERQEGTLFDTNNHSGTRTYTIQFRSSTSGTARIKDAYLVVIAFNV